MDMHMLDVGCGSMALVVNPGGSRCVIDCNMTAENALPFSDALRTCLVPARN
jgi:hypothetical protein